MTSKPVAPGAAGAPQPIVHSGDEQHDATAAVPLPRPRMGLDPISTFGFIRRKEPDRGLASPMPAPAAAARHADWRIAPVPEATPGQAEASLRSALAERGETVTPGRKYMVQIDRTNRGVQDLDWLKGRAFVFEGKKDGALKMLGRFFASSQPDISVSATHREAQEHGVAHIEPGFYTVSQAWERDQLNPGLFRIGTVASARDRNRDGVIQPNERDARDATQILIHDADYGSAGCSVILGFERAAKLIGDDPNGTFDYLLVRR